jgi:DNA topoisomerase-2
MSETKKYVKMSQVEHVLNRSGMYIGSTELIKEDMWIYDDKSNKIEKKNITFNAGLLKLFDEIIVNARDAFINDDTVDYMKIEYNKEENFISITNNGFNSVPVAFHQEYKTTYIPSMIFGEMLTSSNYNDDEEKITGGTNGIGSKAVNIFSTKFIVEIVDSKNKCKFIQTWENNMSIKSEPIVTKIKTKNIQPYIKITFYPDLKRFSIKTLDNDHYNLFYRRTIDIAGICGNKLKVYFNENEIKINSFKAYASLYYPDNEIYYDDSCDRWNVGVVYRNGQETNGETISFVNSIHTYHNGSHASYCIDAIIKSLINDFILKKEKNLKVSPALIKDNLVFFINSTIVNPSFSSQSKDILTSKSDKFGSKYIPNLPFMKKLAKCGIVEQIIELVKFKENSSLKKTDGKKLIRISGIPKLDDANKAGTKDAFKCSLILTEGDSAKTFAVSGLSVIGREYYGVFPLKGKLLNVREAPPAQILANEEITNLKKIIGLKSGEDYTDDTKFNQLRYGRIVILTDADVDGSHIKGLVMNFIHSQWPSLIKRINFITSLATPIVKATKGNDIKSFYNLTDYDNWLATNESNKHWKIKYYKGLGTSTAVEAREYFVDIEDKLINYSWVTKSVDDKASGDENDEANYDKASGDEDDKGSGDEDDKASGDDDGKVSGDEDDEVDSIVLPYSRDDDEDAILLAFEKTRADDRKVWLQNYDKNNTLKYEEKVVRYSKFIHSDLIHFSNDDLSRSIPSLIDGLKPSQRKILYGAFLRGLDKIEVKVAQLAGFVSDRAAYHHGEASLTGAIIGMAQNYMGSNNINTLKPNGQFGTRLNAGKDSASPRYIWTKLEDLTPIIYNTSDEPVLQNQVEDNEPIEPVYYAPIIPMILVNGTQGIGTGFATKIPPYDPMEIIVNLKAKLLSNKEFEPMDPYWSGFEGIIAKIDEFNYEIYGTYLIKDNKLIITELPVGESTYGYKEFLEKLLEGDDNKKIVPTKGKPVKKVTKAKESNPFLGYTENNTDTKIYFELEFEPGYLETAKDIDKTYHLFKKYSITNMHLFDSNGTIKKYNSPVEIMDEYFDIRLALYAKRKAHELELLDYQVKIISNKVRFILMIVEKELIVNNVKKADIELELEKHKFPKLVKENSYAYLLSMPIYNLTMEKIEELKEQQKDKEELYEVLEKLTIENMWLNELNKLEKEYTKWSAAKVKEASDNKPNKKVKKSKK